MSIKVTYYSLFVSNHTQHKHSQTMVSRWLSICGSCGLDQLDSHWLAGHCRRCLSRSLYDSCVNLCDYISIDVICQCTTWWSWRDWQLVHGWCGEQNGWAGSPDRVHMLCSKFRGGAKKANEVSEKFSTGHQWVRNVIIWECKVPICIKNDYNLH